MNLTGTLLEHDAPAAPRAPLLSGTTACRSGVHHFEVAVESRVPNMALRL